MTSWTKTIGIAAIAFAGTFGLGGLYIAAADAAPAPLPRCQTEDGNDGGEQCYWVSPRTGLVYLNPVADAR